MPIYPLPQFEADVKDHLAEEDRKVYEALKAPRTMVVRFGAMKLVGEFPYSGSVKPGCGSKIVVRSFRGTEVGEMLTSTCPNSGCSKSVSRRDMLGYIQNSGGRDYPFFTDGRVLRIAEVEDLNAQQRLEQSKHELRMQAKAVVERMNLQVKIVDAEPILGGETLTFYYLSEERREVRDLTEELGREFRTHVELRAVGARDEARLTADYERCGQYCCCKNFLKVLKPVSMKSAKVQKATLDPLKISGRCGRLMCCLRYEDQTYEELRKTLPRKKSRVGTPDGDGTVIDGQILTQLVLVRLDAMGTDGKFQDVAVPVENLSEPVSKVPPKIEAPPPGYGASRDARGARPVRPARPSMPPPRAPAAPVGDVAEEADGDEMMDQTGPVSGSASGPVSGSAPARAPEDRRDQRPPRARDDRRERRPGPPSNPSGQGGDRGQRDGRPAGAPPEQRGGRPPREDRAGGGDQGQRGGPPGGGGGQQRGPGGDGRSGRRPQPGQRPRNEPGRGDANRGDPGRREHRPPSGPVGRADAPPQGSRGGPGDGSDRGSPNLPASGPGGGADGPDRGPDQQGGDQQGRRRRRRRRGGGGPRPGDDRPQGSGD